MNEETIESPLPGEEEPEHERRDSLLSTDSKQLKMHQFKARMGQIPYQKAIEELLDIQDFTTI